MAALEKEGAPRTHKTWHLSGVVVYTVLYKFFSIQKMLIVFKILQTIACNFPTEWPASFTLIRCSLLSGHFYLKVCLKSKNND